MRAYELLTIASGDLDENGFNAKVEWVEGLALEAGADVVTTDKWGRRRFAYEIDHKLEGYYTVYELLAEPGALDGVERAMRLDDDMVRHKLIHLPTHEAERRGLIGDGPRPEVGRTGPPETLGAGASSSGNDGERAKSGDDSPSASAEPADSGGVDAAPGGETPSDETSGGEAEASATEAAGETPPSTTESE